MTGWDDSWLEAAYESAQTGDYDDEPADAWGPSEADEEGWDAREEWHRS
jgi:hypothetical protein